MVKMAQKALVMQDSFRKEMCKKCSIFWGNKDISLRLIREIGQNKGKSASYTDATSFSNRPHVRARKIEISLFHARLRASFERFLVGQVNKSERSERYTRAY